MVIVTTRRNAGLRLIAALFFRLVLSLPRRLLSLTLDKIADLGRDKTAGAFKH